MQLRSVGRSMACDVRDRTDAAKRRGHNPSGRRVNYEPTGPKRSSRAFKLMRRTQRNPSTLTLTGSRFSRCRGRGTCNERPMRYSYADFGNCVGMLASKFAGAYRKRQQ
jgi:hypothetical protein